MLGLDGQRQIQALDLTQPDLPLRKCRAGTMTHDYKRNGTTTLFATLNILDRKVIGQCMPRHKHPRVHSPRHSEQPAEHTDPDREAASGEDGDRPQHGRRNALQGLDGAGIRSVMRCVDRCGEVVGHRCTGPRSRTRR